MNQRIAVLSGLLLPLAICTASAQPPDVSGYQINWIDEFNGGALDTSKWTAVFNTNPTNNSLHAYLPGNVSVSGGNLIIASTNQPFGGFDYRSGQVISTATQRYGRFEIRGNLPTSRGMWPAIWLLPLDAAWPSQGEIDIMENRGDQPQLTSSAFHWGTNPPFNHNFVFSEQETYVDSNATNYHDSFHVYAAEWDPTQIRFFVDGVHYYTVRDGFVGNFLTGSQSDPMSLIINTAIGGNFLDDPDETTQWPQKFEVDYVYVYDRIGDAVLALENGGFETTGASLSGWTLFGNAINNVRAVSSPTENGSGALKVYGQFNGSMNYSGVEQGITVTPGDQVEVQCRCHVDSADTIAGTANEVLLKFDFYNTNYGAFGSSEYISSDSLVIADSSTPNDQWIEHTLTATVPAGAIEARVAIVFAQSSNNTGAVFVDSIEYTNSSESETLTADNLLVNNGKTQTGDVSSTHQSDDDYLQVGAEATVGAPVELIFETTSAEIDPSAVEVKIESAANTFNLQQNLAAFNYDLQQYETIANDAGTLIDTPVTVGLKGNLARFVRDGDGQMRLRIVYQPDGPVVIFPWKIRIDALSWTVSP